MFNIKLLTLNTHSLIEDNYLNKTKDFTAATAILLPDVIALQEVNQSRYGAAEPCGDGYFPCKKDIVIRRDNHVKIVADMLLDKGIKYYWTWLPIKCGYKIYDEGIALMSRSPIINTDIFTVSKSEEYTNWRTRKLLGIQTELCDDWFYSVHYGWWEDKDEPFYRQWETTEEKLSEYSNIWLMGDFNNPAHLRGEGYDMIVNSRFKDSYAVAETRDSGVTVANKIDGWRSKSVNNGGMRIDYILFSGDKEIKSSQVIFNGENYPVVSDHFGVLAEL